MFGLHFYWPKSLFCLFNHNPNYTTVVVLRISFFIIEYLSDYSLNLLKLSGLEPMHYLTVEEAVSLKCSKEFVMQSWVGSSPTEILRKELYLVLSLLFLCLVGFTYTFPRVVSHFKALWVSYGPHLNLEIFGETSQILGRVLQMIDVNRIWTKLKLCQTRSFISGAKNARVWASSLASVSLGKTTSSWSSS